MSQYSSPIMQADWLPGSLSAHATGPEQVKTMSQLKYYDAPSKKPVPAPKMAVHTEFLRTGRIDRHPENWNVEEKRYLTHEEVAARTGRKLEAAGGQAHQKINSFHASMRFPRVVFHRTIAGSPHLGYCHVTTARTRFAQHNDVRWSFYIANFFADIGENEAFFEKIRLGYSRMYFAVAIEPGETNGRMTLNRAVREDGLLFRTNDPKAALKNVLMLGARNEALRKIIRSL